MSPDNGPVWMRKRVQEMTLAELDETVRDERASDVIRDEAATRAAEERDRDRRAAQDYDRRILELRSRHISTKPAGGGATVKKKGAWDRRSPKYAGKAANRQAKKASIPFGAVWAVVLAAQGQGLLPSMSEWDGLWWAIALLVALTGVAVWVVLFALAMLNERNTEWHRKG